MLLAEHPACCKMLAQVIHKYKKCKVSPSCVGTWRDADLNFSQSLTLLDHQYRANASHDVPVYATPEGRGVASFRLAISFLSGILSVGIYR